ncbi:MAG: CDP-diacylglycerol--glycerol-3-phosphate 3-phosphatidyltransferase [Amphiplicatus sp.]
MANLLTLLRILLIVPFTAAFLWDASWNMSVAFCFFAASALTDFFDGYVARKRNEVSALGAALDPIADKLLVAAALFLLVRNGVVREAGVVAAIVIVLREILVSGLREALARRGEALAVTGLAKWKTAGQLLAVGALLAAAPGGIAGEGLRPLASGLLWLAAVLTFWTGADYASRAAALLSRPMR